MCRSAMTQASARSSSTRPRARPCAASSLSIVNSGCVRRVKEAADRLGLRTKCSTTTNGTERGGKPFSRGHLYTLLSNPIYTGQIAHKGELHSGLQPALIDDESWSTVRDQLAANTSNHRRRAKAAEPSLLAGLLVDARGERLTPSHAVKKGRRYRYYVSAAVITDAGTDREGWRLAAREIEEAVIRILADALTSPASLVERFGAGEMSSDQVRKLLSRAEPVAALYEQRRVHHIGSFPMLEDQQCGFTTDFDRVAAGFSPDRVDALVWALTDLLVEPMAHSGIFELYREQARALKEAEIKHAPKIMYAKGSVEYEKQQQEQGSS